MADPFQPAYEIPQGPDSPMFVNPYDVGGGYGTLPEAQKAAQQAFAGGQAPGQWRQPSPSGIAGSGLTSSDVIAMGSMVAAPWIMGATGIPDAAGAGATTAAASAMPAAIPETAGALAGMGLVEIAPGVFEAAAPAGAGAIGAAGAADGSPGATAGAAPISMLNATSPLTSLDPATASALGISFSPQIPGEFGAMGMMAGGAPTFGEGAGLAAGDYNAGTAMTAAGADYGMAAAGGGAVDSTLALLKKLGISPATAALLGISGVQALSTPKLPQAAQDLQKTGAAGAQAATGVIQSGGTSGPAWAQQKASIDATIDQQVKEQIQAMLQQAQNSGMGADSQVTQQQVNKIKNQAETMRQQMYAQAQAQNVQAALQQLGISDQALSQVANTQFQQSAQARAGAAQTASLAIMLSALGKG